MPYKTRKVRNKNCYSVKNVEKKKVFSKCTSLKNAKLQMKLLRALQFNKNFVPRAQTRKTRRKRDFYLHG